MSGRVNLPVLDVGATVAEAMSAMAAHGTSAIVVDDGGSHALVFGGALVRANDRKVHSLSEVPRHSIDTEAEAEIEWFSFDDGVHFGGDAPAPREFQLNRIANGIADVTTPRESAARTLARPDLFRCTVILDHTFPDPPPDVDRGDECPRCIEDALVPVGVVDRV